MLFQTDLAQTGNSLIPLLLLVCGMPLQIEVVNYAIKNAILPTVDVTLRAKTEIGKNSFYSNAFCDVYFGKETQNIATAPFIERIPAPINQYASASGEVRFAVPLTFSGEVLFNLEKHIPVGQDVYFILDTTITILERDQNGLFNIGTWGCDQTVLEIAASKWAKIGYDWGKEMALMPIGPKLYERIKDLSRTGKYVGGTDDFLDELLSRYTKELQR
jgi:hypothetical protein